jgi:transcriptional regulator with XRE-family HTH domain
VPARAPRKRTPSGQEQALQMSRRLCQQFGAALERKRATLGWTQEQVAKRTYLGQTFVSRVEKGQSVTIESMSVLARAVGLNVPLTITDDASPPAASPQNDASSEN